jgi:hypothetical protein
MSRIYEHVITTNCCDESKKHKVVKLQFNFEDSYSIDLPSTKKPKWLSFGFRDFSWGKHESYIEVNFCPFCGEKVPEIEINEKALKYMINDGDGNYCVTCGEREMCCECLPPYFRWKPVGVKVKLPNDKKIKKEE